MPSFLLSKIIIPLHLVFILGYLACVQPGPDGISSLLPVAFFTFGLFEVSLLFPSARYGEDVHQARSRTFRSVFRDPVFYFGLLAFLFVIIQALNGPRNFLYDRTIKAWTYSAGRIPFLPAGIDQVHTIHAAFWVLIVFVTILTVRNALGRKGRFLTLHLLLAFSSIFAIFSLTSYALAPSNLPKPVFAHFFSAQEAGAFFLMTTCTSFGLLLAETVNENRKRFSLRLLLIAFVLNLLAALYSLSALTIAILAISLALILIYALTYFALETREDFHVSFVAVAFLILAFFAFLHVIAYPDNRLHGISDKIFTGPWQSETEIAQKSTLQNAAWRMFADHSLFGVGSWNFGNENGYPNYLADEDWDLLPQTDSPVRLLENDFVQFLVEFGLVGFILFALPFVCVLLSFIIHCAKIIRYGTEKKLSLFAENEKELARVAIFDLFPLRSFSLLIAVVATSVISFYSSVFWSPVVLLTWTVLLSVAVSILPKPLSPIESSTRK